MQDRYKALLYVSLMGIMMGSNVVISRYSLGMFDPLVFNTLQFSLASLIFCIYFLVSRSHRFPLSIRTWLRAGGYGVLGTGLPTAAMITALQYLSSGVVSLFMSLNTVMVMIWSAIFLGENNFSRRKLLGIFIAITGAGLILLRGENGLADIATASWLGYLFTAMLLILVSSSLVYARHFLEDIDTLDAVLVRLVVASVILIPAAALIYGFDFSRVPPYGWALVLFSSLFNALFMFLLDVYIIKRFGAVSASLVNYILPVVASLLGVLMLGETITITILAGMALIFSGLAILN